jgi:kinesin family protein 15
VVTLCFHAAVSDALEVLRTGTAHRQVAATDMNASSSRSHCVFTCHIESRLEPQAGMVNVRSSRLHLVDLAGSERLKSLSAAAALAASLGGTGGSLSSSFDNGMVGSSGAVGGGGSGDAKEAAHINKSLSALGNVILKLTEHAQHIPYRDCKLTFLLQVRTCVDT